MAQFTFPFPPKYSIVRETGSLVQAAADGTVHSIDIINEGERQGEHISYP